VTTISPVRSILRAVATTVVPESSALNELEWREIEDVIDQALVKRTSRVRRQLIVFLRLLQHLAVARYGKPLTRLNARQRVAFLESIERAPLLLIRRGFWGVRTLIFMGYYTRADVASAIGYRAHRDGWAARGGTLATVPLAPTLWVEP
jgi:hypothetical protein